jgi:hypothetical protein
MASRIARSSTTGKILRAAGGKVTRFAAGTGGSECPCCGGGGSPECTCIDDPDILRPECCCIPIGEAGSCAGDAHLCSDICDRGPQPDCPCPGNTGILRPSCCCLPVGDADSCAGNATLCAAPCYPSSGCSAASGCQRYDCGSLGQCCYDLSKPYTITGSYRFKSCECQGGLLLDITANGSVNKVGGSTISSSGSATIIHKRFYGSGWVTTCTISGGSSAGGTAGSCSGPNFVVSIPGRATCPSCYVNGPIPAAGTCATEGYPTFSTFPVTTGCGNNNGGEQLACQDSCSGSNGVFNEGTYNSGCRHSMYDSASSGQCWPTCVGVQFTEIKKCSVVMTGGDCAAAAAIGAAMSPGYEMLESGMLVPNRAMAKRCGSGARCPLCARPGWDGRWRNMDDLRDAPAFGPHRKTPPKGPRRNAEGTQLGELRYAEKTQLGRVALPGALPGAERPRDRGLGDTVGRIIKATTGIEAKEGCGCAKRKDLLNRIVPYGRRKTRRPEQPG